MTALLACSAYALNCLYLPLAVLMPRAEKRRLQRSDLLTAASLSAVGGAWLLFCSSQQKQVGWIHTSAGADVLSSFVRVGVSAPTSHTGEGLVTLVSVGLGIRLTLVALEQVAQRRTRSTALPLLAVWVLPPLVACCAVALGKDIFVERYFTPSTIGIALIVGQAATTATRHVSARNVAATLLLSACIPSFVASHAPDGHWGENIGLHQSHVDEAGPGRVAFVAPRNRAALFARGRLSPQWEEAAWWKQARMQGSLWGPPENASPGTTVVLVDTRSASELTRIPGCAIAHRSLLRREARFTSLDVECAR